MRVRNWDKWQSYRKDRGQPPWIKVHRALMRDENWVALTDGQRGQLIAIWMLAADRDGNFPDDPKVVKKLCFMEHEPDLEALITHGFVEGRRQPDAKVTPKRRQRVTPEENRVDAEKKREEETGGLPTAQAIDPSVHDHRDLVEGFKLVYHAFTGHPCNAAQHHYIIAAKLMKAHGYDVCVEKIKLLGVMCEEKSRWFTKDGFGSFTLETLSRHWNSILPSQGDKRDSDLKAELRKQEDIREQFKRPI